MEKPVEKGEAITVVWLKRDLRMRDHAPLAAAVASGLPTVVLYCFEPSICHDARHSQRHWRFVYESLADLQEQGLSVVVRYAEVVETLASLARRYRIKQLLSHQETGHLLSFRRDRAVRDWCVTNEVAWREFVQDGVIRGRKHRRGFADHLDAWLNEAEIEVKWQSLRLLSGAEAGLSPTLLPRQWTRYHAGFQRGGESYAHRYFSGFTGGRAKNYGRQLGNPTLSRKSCSRLSPYLAWGCLSLRTVVRWTSSGRVPRELRWDLENFRDRLGWRVHYYQKLEAEFQLEKRAICAPLEALDRRSDPENLRAWKAGKTGFPMVDAALRCLTATGWLNFRLRAMLVTFASFYLWHDWRPVAKHLGRLFLDYDPGIHYAQLQMQAGTTGYHAPRQFNPHLQGEQYDPEGTFVHRWVPELRQLPAPWCHYPERMTELERHLYGFDPATYPAPAADYNTVVRANQDRYWALRNAPATQAALPAIWEKHCYPADAERYRRQIDGGSQRVKQEDARSSGPASD